MPQSTLQPKVLRSRKPIAVQTNVLMLHAQGKSKLAISKELGIDYDTVTRILVDLKVPELAQQSVEKIFAEIGITPHTIGESLREGMSATDVRLATFEGKFTDRVEVPDSTVRHRNTETAAKILGLFPREDASVQAQLFVRLPDTVLTPGHPKTCTCPECCAAWEALPVATVEPTP